MITLTLTKYRSFLINEAHVRAKKEIHSTLCLLCAPSTARTNVHVGLRAPSSIRRFVRSLHSSLCPEAKPNLLQTSTPAVCTFFTRGKCTRGSSCPFYHPTLPTASCTTTTQTPPPSPIKSVTPAAPSVVTDSGGSPTKVCSFFLRNTCKNGDNCKFLHPSEQV